MNSLTKVRALIIPNRISVIIPPQEFSFNKYISNSCYLKETLIEAGYKDVRVGGIGNTWIGNIHYKPEFQDFNSSVVEKMFSQNKEIPVTLIRQL